MYLVAFHMIIPKICSIQPLSEAIHLFLKQLNCLMMDIFKSEMKLCKEVLAVESCFCFCLNFFFLV